MKACNKDVADKKLKGDEWKKFISSYLSAWPDRVRPSTSDERAPTGSRP
jgi:hypothetical protein